MGKRILFLIVLVLLLSAAPSLTAGQGSPVITIELAAFEGNPALPHGEPGAWDADVWFSDVVYHDGIFHMLYSGADLEKPGMQGIQPEDVGIGYATSTDGVTWMRYEGNPLSPPEPSLGPLVLNTATVEGDSWVIYVCSAPYVGTTCDTVYRATAPTPTASWSVSPEAILQKGMVIGDWDRPQIFPSSVVVASDGYRMYYHAEANEGIGMATSVDGITWTKYDDPATADRKHANSDPIMPPQAGIWDSPGMGFPVVLQRDGGWEMFYSGPMGIGYATSDDGITWTRYPGNPVLAFTDVQPYLDAVVVVDGVYYLYYTEMMEWNIGVATVTVTWE